jgi:ABC-2 type transport system ATP-binding protein
MEPPGGDLAIDLRSVEKTYSRKVQALRGIRMQVRRGEVFGLLGPNGAGKTTLVKIIMKVIHPTHAEGTVLGRPLGHTPTLAKVGYLPENHSFPPYFTGQQALEFYAAMAKVDRPTRRRRATELLRMVGMSGWAKARAGTYSKGMQQRVGLAQALVNDPQLVVLDEPTDGLDPVGRREVREVLRRLRHEGKTIFLNSHLLSEVEQVCDRVAILVEGALVRQGTLEDLTARGRYYEIELHDASAEGLREAIRAVLPGELRGPTPAAAAPASSGAPAVAGYPLAGGASCEAWSQGSSSAPLEKGTLRGGETLELDGNLVRIHTDQPAAIQPAIDALRKRNLTIHSVRLIRQSLEDFFIETVADLHNGRPAAEATGKGDPP